jgi:hypothetical protein
MSRRCLNPGCYQSGSDDAGPPEFESDNYVLCANCDAEIDLDDDPNTVNAEGDYFCEDCDDGNDGEGGESE